MPFTPRGRDAATLLAIIVTAVLAVAWLRSSDGAAPQVPAGLSVETLPAAVQENSETPSDSTVPAAGGEGESARGARMPKRRHAARTAKRRRTRRGTAGEAGGQDQPATAPAPSPGSGAVPVPSGGSGATGGTPAEPEFGLE